MSETYEKAADEVQDELIVPDQSSEYNQGVADAVSEMTFRWRNFRNSDQRKLWNIDFDATLTQGNVEYWNGERPQPDESVCEAVRQKYYDYDIIIVWTARPYSEANQIAAHLTEWEVPYHGIRCSKGSATQYVDDKALSPSDFVEEVIGERTE